MNATRHLVAEKLANYLQRRSTLEELVDWAELQIMESDFESQPVRNVTARLGLGDVRAFGLTWDDCQQLLDQLGYKARVEIVA